MVHPPVRLSVSLAYHHKSLLLCISTFCYYLQEYDKALKYTKGILAVEPKNHQAVDLKNIIEKKMRNGKQANVIM